jgi:hypothetical protein
MLVTGHQWGMQAQVLAQKVQYRGTKARHMGSAYHDWRKRSVDVSRVVDSIRRTVSITTSGNLDEASVAYLGMVGCKCTLLGETVFFWVQNSHAYSVGLVGRMVMDETVLF